MNQAVIDIQGITKTYVNGKLSVPVLHGIDLQVNKGEFVSIMGPSGSGKSTFMNILGCLDRPTTGSYRLNGDEVATLSDDELINLFTFTVHDDISMSIRCKTRF